jgi:hypothetical protein
VRSFLAERLSKLLKTKHTVDEDVLFTVVCVQSSLWGRPAGKIGSAELMAAGRQCMYVVYIRMDLWRLYKYAIFICKTFSLLMSNEGSNVHRSYVREKED